MTCLIPLKQEDLLKKFFLKIFLFLDYLRIHQLLAVDFLLSHTVHFDKSITLPFFVLATFEFLLSVFFLHFKQYDSVVSYIV